MTLRDKNNHENNNYLTSSSSSNNESLSNNYLKSRSVTRHNSTASSQTNVTLDPSLYINRVFSICNFEDERIHNSLSYMENSDDYIKEETNIGSSPKEKYQMFKKQLTIILSCIYAVFIVTLGLVIYISDIIVGNTALAEIFSLYLLIIGFVYILYLVIDIRIYVNKSKTECFVKADASSCDAEYREWPEGSVHLSIPTPSWSVRLQDTPTHHYCFNKGRHSGSFYLKIGAAAFCLGHLIHSGLLLGYQIIFLTSEGDAFYECASVPTLVLDITYPIYSFFLLYFIYKHSNVIINTKVELGRFALMHCIASSLCFWVWTILRETMDSLTHHSIENDGKATDTDDEVSPEERISATSFERSTQDVPVAMALTSYSKHGAKELIRFLNGSATTRVGTSCTEDPRMNIIYQNFSPYLYPFTVEYSILVVGVLFIIWQNIGACNINSDNNSDRKHCPVPGPNKENGFASNIVINVDCHSASTGLFAGILILVGSIVSIILFFIALSNPIYVSHGVFVNAITEIVFLSLMTISAIVAYRKIMRLDINYHPVSLLDDMLLFICIPAFFLNAIFSIIPAVQKENGLSIANIILQVIQVLIQTPLIIDGLRRCSNCRELRLEKPGRGLITFLVVCNVATWITETFEIKSRDLTDARSVFYGDVWWTIIGHMTVPLIMFYRFHSSVCLVDIWKSAYEPAED